MSDREKKAQLIEELQRLRQRVAESEASEAERKQLEEALRESEERYRSIVESIDIGLNFIDCDHNIVMVNAAQSRHFNKAPHEMVGKKCFQEFEKRDAICPHCPGVQAIATGQPVEVETEAVRDDGSRFNVRLRAFPVFGQDGTVRGFIEIGQDITKRKAAEAERERAEEALAKERNLLRTVIDNLPDFIYAKDTESRYFISNAAHVHSLGAATPEEVVGKSVFELFPQELAEQYYADDQEVIRSGQPLLNREERSIDEAGDSVWNLTTKVPLRDRDGKIVGLVGIAKDITERKWAEEALQEAHEELGRYTVGLERQAIQLQAAAEVSHATTSILDSEELMRQVVDLVRERFGLYYAGLFLVDQTGEWTGEPGKWAVLRAGTGEAGQKMLEQGHKLEVGSESMIGWCVANQQARIALDVGEEAVRFANPLLPETRSELALPLISRGQVIGALTIQSTQEAAFSKEDIAVFQTMADQLANAIANARLYGALTREQYLARAFMDNVPDHIYFKDRQSRFISISKAMSDWFGLSNPAQAVGKTDFDFFTEDHARPAYEDEQEIIRTGQPLLDMEERETWPDRPDTWVLTSKMPLRDEAGNIVGTFGISRDITGRKAAEAEREQLLAALAHRALQLQTAAEVSRAASSILSPDELIQQVVNLVRERFDLYYAGLFLVDDSGKWAVLRAGTGEAGQKMAEQGHKLEVGGESMIGWCVANQQARIALDVTSASSVEPGEEAVRFANPLLPETRSELALPLVSRGEAIGAMTVQSTQSAAFSEEDIAVLQTMADQLAIAIENVRLFEDTQSRLAQLTALQGTTRAVASTLELDKLLNLITQQATTLLQSEGGIINLVDWEKKEDEVIAASGSQAHALGFRSLLEGSLSGWVALHNQPVISNRLRDDDRVDPRYRSGEVPGQNAAIAPLTIKDQVIGTLVVMDKPGGFDQADLDLLIAFANQATIALQNARLFEETQQTSFLMGLRVKELACLNDIGRKIEETPPVPKFLQWVADRVPPAMRYPDVCRAAIEFDGQVYGSPEAVSLPCQMVQALRIGGQVVGRAYISYTEEHDFIDEESALLGDIVRRVSGYIESRRLFEETQRSAEELAALNEMSRALTACTSVKELLGETYRGATRLLDTTNLFVALYDPAKDEIIFPLDVTAMEEDKFDTLPADKGLTGYIIRNRKSVLIKENLPERLAEMGVEMVGEPAASWLGVPLIVGDQAVGMIGVQSFTTPRAYDEHDQALLTAIASQVAIAVQNARLFEQAQARAERERLVRTITDRVRRGIDTEDIMRIGLQELSQLLGADRLIVRLGTRAQLCPEPLDPSAEPILSRSPERSEGTAEGLRAGPSTGLRAGRAGSAQDKPGEELLSSQ